MTAREALEQAVRDAKALGLPRALVARLEDAIGTLVVVEREKEKRR